MGFFSGIANFGSKILGGVKKAAQWVAPAIHKILSTVSGPVSMIHPAIGGALGAGANLAGAVDRLQIRTVRQLITNDIAYYIQYQKRSNSSGGMMSNEEYQLFIDNNNALVYAANNQIVDGMASDYALKIEPNGLLTIKILKVINFDFVAQINQLINQVNLLQQSVGTTEQDITDIKNDIDTINQELSRQTHFRGYYLLNTDIQNLPDSANGDFSFSAESGSVWMYDQNWYNSGDIVLDQVTPASDATPLSDGTATAGISTEYSRGDHVHPLNVTTTIPISDSASGSVGTTNYYARNNHSHPLNITTSVHPQDSVSGSVGTTNYYARNDHSHPINVELMLQIFLSLMVLQLIYDGNVTATKFIKTGGLTTEVLCSNGDTKAISDIVSNYVDLTTNQTITGVKTFDTIKKTNGINQQILLADGTTTPLVLAQKQYYVAGTTTYIKLCTFNAYIQPSSTSVEFTLNCRSGFGLIQFNQSYSSNGLSAYQYKLQTNFDYGMQACYIVYFGTDADKYGELWAKLDAWSNSLIIKQTNQSQDTVPLANVLNTDATGALPTGYSSMFTLYPNIYKSPFQINPVKGNGNEGLRIANTSSIYSLFCIGCDPNTVNGAIANQWSIYKKTDGSLLIARTSEQNTANRGLQISTDGNTLTFNSSVIAGTGATNGATNGSVNYSAGNSILWGVNSVGTEGGFYSDGAKVYWRAKPVTFGSVPP
ncbi:MAG: hypothetical protein EZS28_031646 [Streblomastix strix]|uniref:Uncharacterized protein n=1 Tax=Streblomastix strix TaxID=222440 RepID=A0A5J4UR12_9EUKA|nr:MAG: hypothetical protein EZS28_031646 [Streblomastix strix]